MSRKFYINLSLFLLFVILLFPGCRQPALPDEFLLTDEEKETVPFKGTETVRYIYNDSVISIACDYRKDTIMQGYSSTFESDETRLEGGNFFIRYYLQARDVWYSYNRFSIYWGDHENNLGGGTSFILPLDTDYLEDSQGYLEQLTVLGNNYQSVFYDSLEVDTASAGLKKMIVLFYSKDAGLIRMDFRDGTSWLLKEIEWK